MSTVAHATKLYTNCFKNLGHPPLRGCHEAILGSTPCTRTLIAFLFILIYWVGRSGGLLLLLLGITKQVTRMRGSRFGRFQALRQSVRTCYGKLHRN